MSRSWFLFVAVAVCFGVCASSRVAMANHAAIKTRDSETERAGVKIALYEKWNPAEEKSWKSNGKVILLVHGATWSSHCTFDPLDDYSLMNTLAEQGYDVWALDLHGYGHSGKTNRDWTDAASAAEDVDAAADYIRALRWVERVHVLGYQWGGQAAALFAENHPKKVSKLVLFGLRYQQVEKKQAPESQYRQNSNANAMLRPEDGDLDPEFVRLRARLCLTHDPKSPNGALTDVAQPSQVDPGKIKAATLIIQGEHDAEPNVLQDRLNFYTGLGSRSRSFVVLAGLGKYANFEKNRNRFEAAVTAFLDQP